MAFILPRIILSQCDREFFRFLFYHGTRTYHFLPSGLFTLYNVTFVKHRLLFGSALFSKHYLLIVVYILDLLSGFQVCAFVLIHGFALIDAFEAFGIEVMPAQFYHRWVLH